MTIRLRDGLKTDLQKVGATNGRSLSEEIESRLERSRLVEDHLALIYDDARTGGFISEALDAKRLIETHLSKSVWDDFEGAEAMKAALTRLLAQRAPQPTAKFKKRMTAYKRYVEGKMRPWRDRAGGLGLLSNPEANPPPTLKLSPVDKARALGRVAVDVVRRSRSVALVEALKKGVTNED